jgi:hypothetical protein
MDYYKERAKEILLTIPKGPRFSWEFRQRDLAGKIMSHDMGKFLSWPVIRSSMHAGYTPLAAKERDSLPKELIRLTVDPKVGGSDVPKSPEGASGSFIRQVFVLDAFEKNLTLLSSLDSILEFGGGYGASDVVLRRMGFSGSHYVYDFPILHLVREWYLAQNLGPIDFHTVSLFDIPDKLEVDAFISVCAIDESPLELRNKFMEGFRADYYLFFLSNNFYDVDNKKWCEDWFKHNGIEYEAVPVWNGRKTMFTGRRNDTA